MRQNKFFAATLKAVSEFTAQLEVELQSLPDDVRAVVVVAVHELCVNIVQHAYAGVPGMIRFEMDWSAQGIYIIIEDQAPTPFVPPARVSPPDTRQLQEHGRGLFIIDQAFDHVAYKRLPTGNRWQLSRASAEG